MKKRLTNWDDIIENIVVKIKELRSKGAPPEDVAKGLVALKVFGCRLGTVEPAGGRKYLRVRWSKGGRRRELGVGPMDHEAGKILKEAGLYLEGASSLD